MFFYTSFKRNFSASWIIRAAFSVDVTCPPEELLIAVEGAKKVGWFRILNISARNWNCLVSVTGNSFIKVKSNCFKPLARRILRPPLP